MCRTEDVMNWTPANTLRWYAFFFFCKSLLVFILWYMTRVRWYAILGNGSEADGARGSRWVKGRGEEKGGAKR